MNSTRTKKLKQQLDSTIMKVVHVRNFQRYLSYNFFNLQLIDLFASRMRARLFYKNINSNKYVADLIKNPIKSKAKTWVSNTIRWLSRHKLNTNTLVEQANAALVAYYKSKTKATETYTFLRKYGFEEIKQKKP